MALKDTVMKMRKHLEEISKDLDKSARGNKAASQRVRTCTIKFAKLAKAYRKESVSSERGGGKKKKTTKKKAAKKKTVKRKATKKKTTHRKTTARRKAPKKKSTARRKKRR